MKSKSLTRALAQTLATTMILSSVMSVSAEESVEKESSESEEIIIESEDTEVVGNVPHYVDENGNEIDLGGMEIVIRDWWSGGWDDNLEYIQENNKNRYDYIQEIQKTYNFTIKEEAISDWGSTPADFVDYVTSGGDENNYVFALRNDAVIVNAMRNGLMYDLATLDCLDFSKAPYSDNKIHELYGVNNSVYATSGKQSEVGTGIYFNKAILNKAGYDENYIYDLQAKNQWTWQAWEDIMKKVQAIDENNDGKPDYAGFDCNYSVATMAAVFSNNGTFVNKISSGEFISEFESENTMQALNWIIDMYDTYAYERPEDTLWDYYQEAYRNQSYAFLVDDQYCMSPGNWLAYSEYYPEDNVEFEYGFVTFPMGPKSSHYTNKWNGLPYAIPACYDEERAWAIAFAYDLYNQAYVLFPDDEADYYERLGCDEDGKKATIDIMRKYGQVGYHEVFDLNIGENFLWLIGPGCREYGWERAKSNISMLKAIVEGGDITYTWGTNDGLTCTYDIETKTATISGSDSINCSLGELTDYVDIEKVKFEKCIISDSIEYMFCNCYRLKSIDFSGVTFEDVTDMSYAFAWCFALETLDMSKLPITSATACYKMLDECYSLNKITLPDEIGTAFELPGTIIDEGESVVPALFIDEEAEMVEDITATGLAGQTIIRCSVEYYGMSMNVFDDGSLSARVYIKVPKALQDDLTVDWGRDLRDLNHGDFCVNYEISEETKEYTVFYVDCDFTSTELQSYIYFRVYYYDIKILSIDCSAKEYLYELAKQSEYRATAYALINYCGAAERYFNAKVPKYNGIYYYSDYEVPAKYSESQSLTEEELEPFKIEGTVFEMGDMSYIGSSLILNNKIGINHYFNLTIGLNDYTFKDNYSNEEYKHDPTRGCVYIGTVSFFDFAKKKSINICNIESKENQNLEYSAGNYIYMLYQQDESNIDNELFELVNALYRFSEALGKLPQNTAH